MRSPSTNLSSLIESVGLSAQELRQYLLNEVDEFLDASDPEAMGEEFEDVLFALACMAWAHSGRHYSMTLGAAETKMMGRLRQHSTLTRHPRRYSDQRIPEIEIGVVHFALGQFGGQWQQFDALRNGTVAEVSLLTDAPFGQPGALTNHCIITFGETDALSYDILQAAATMQSGNTIRVVIPNFLFTRAKKQLSFRECGNLLSLQVLAALDGITTAPGAVAHFHSWEAGFLAECPEFWSRISTMKTIFSPYLTAGRLKALFEQRGGTNWTMTREELSVASYFEQKLCQACGQVLLESSRDYDFYTNWVHPERLKVRSYAQKRAASIHRISADGSLTFLAGGRPVREKGFVELVTQFAALREWASSSGVEVKLSILCRESNPAKGKAYIDEVKQAIAAFDLCDAVKVEPKVSLDELRRRISEVSALIVPSLYDPYCLMAAYAIEVDRPAFISCHAGIAENVTTPDFVFDPETEGDLARAVKSWQEANLAFEFDSRYPSYLDVYLSQKHRS